jgi:hypothetical protein
MTPEAQGNLDTMTITRNHFDSHRTGILRGRQNERCALNSFFFIVIIIVIVIEFFPSSFLDLPPSQCPPSKQVIDNIPDPCRLPLASDQSYPPRPPSFGGCSESKNADEARADGERWRFVGRALRRGRETRNASHTRTRRLAIKAGPCWHKSAVPSKIDVFVTGEPSGLMEETNDHRTVHAGRTGTRR